MGLRRVKIADPAGDPCKSAQTPRSGHFPLSRAASSAKNPVWGRLAACTSAELMSFRGREGCGGLLAGGHAECWYLFGV